MKMSTKMLLAFYLTSIGTCLLTMGLCFSHYEGASLPYILSAVVGFILICIALWIFTLLEEKS